MYDIIIPNKFHQQCDPNKFRTEETEVSFNTIHNTLVSDKYPKQKLNYPTPSNIKANVIQSNFTPKKYLYRIYEKIK